MPDNPRYVKDGNESYWTAQYDYECGCLVSLSSVTREGLMRDERCSNHGSLPIGVVLKRVESTDSGEAS